MPIAQFLNDRRFDIETKRIMGLAFEMMCVAFRLADRSDPVTNIIAERIIEIAQDGERNPDLLCERALNALRGQDSRPPQWRY